MWDLIRDFSGFLAARKRWWLMPIVFGLVLLAGLILFTESAIVAPFIYALF